MESVRVFEYSLAHWSAFLTAAVLLNLSPGPDIAFMLGQTLKHGRQAGFVGMLGIWSGAFVHVLLAALGLSAVLATSATAFALVKWLGAAYLLYLGVQALRSSGGAFVGDVGSSDSAPQYFSIFRQGLWVSLLNPKVAVFFLAFLPQFVVDGAGPVSAQLFLHGFLIIVVAAFIEPPLIIAGSKLTASLKRNPKLGLWMDRGLGALFVGLGLRLATSDRA